MGKNYMKYIANLFGLELGEPFTIVNSNGDMDKNGYIFTENGLEKSDKHINGIYEHTERCNTILTNMFRGYYDIKKIPWKPATGRNYFMPYISGGEADFDEKTYWDFECDEKRYKAGMICRTENEAVEKAEKMLAALKDDCND